MAAYEWIEKAGKKILYMNLTSKNVDELESKVAEFRAVIRQQPARSLLTISDVAGGHFDREMKKVLQYFVKANEPYIKMSVVIGIKGLQKVVYQGVLRATGRDNLVVKESREDAVAYLLSLP